ncbi:hypothetical protein [Motiliproteus sediminis]|uniref:hypothetical protein n=1 Tax=Motiliproteus sediminis TaxID=1468178 RepID=UPI001AEFB2DA|nr:hypothetical protein [Motiliproteus sediminis]
MKYFVPLDDDQLYRSQPLKQYRLVPYDPALHLSAVRKRYAQKNGARAEGRTRDANGKS